MTMTLQVSLYQQDSHLKILTLLPFYGGVEIVETW
jgi:hypothetical protein